MPFDALQKEDVNRTLEMGKEMLSKESVRARAKQIEDNIDQIFEELDDILGGAVFDGRITGLISNVRSKERSQMKDAFEEFFENVAETRMVIHEIVSLSRTLAFGQKVAEVQKKISDGTSEILALDAMSGPKEKPHPILAVFDGLEGISPVEATFRKVYFKAAALLHDAGKLTEGSNELKTRYRHVAEDNEVLAMIPNAMIKFLMRTHHMLSDDDVAMMKENGWPMNGDRMRYSEGIAHAKELFLPENPMLYEIALECLAMLIMMDSYDGALADRHYKTDYPSDSVGNYEMVYQASKLINALEKEASVGGEYQEIDEKILSRLQSFPAKMIRALNESINQTAKSLGRVDAVSDNSAFQQRLEKERKIFEEYGMQRSVEGYILDDYISSGIDKANQIFPIIETIASKLYYMSVEDFREAFSHLYCPENLYVQRARFAEYFATELHKQGVYTKSKSDPRLVNANDFLLKSSLNDEILENFDDFSSRQILWFLQKYDPKVLGEKRMGRKPVSLSDEERKQVARKLGWRIGINPLSGKQSIVPINPSTAGLHAQKMKFDDSSMSSLEANYPFIHA